MSEFIYFKSVPGKLVTRFGTGTLIGAEIVPTKVEKNGRFPQTETEVKWSDDPVAIPQAEYGRFRREYARCIRDGSLVEVKAEDPVNFSEVSKDK